MRGWGIEIVEVEYREAKNLGVNLVALGDGKVLSMAGAEDLNAKMRALGFEVYDPDMSMFTLGGGGVHCLSQALCRRGWAGVIWTEVQEQPETAIDIKVRTLASGMIEIEQLVSKTISGRKKWKL